MSLDQYQPCLCGSGKKFKFCCSHDLLADVDKVLRMLQGNQRAAAFEQVNHLITSKGPRTALLILKANLALSLDEQATAAAAVQVLMEQAPTNPLVRSLASLVACARGNVAEAIEKLQRALEVTTEMVSGEVVEATLAVGSLLLEKGDPLGARAYFQLGHALSGEEDSRALEILRQIDEAPSASPLLKQTYELVDCPATVAWKNEFDAAKKLGDRNLWWKSCESFAALSERLPPHPAILRNLAVLRSRLGNTGLTQSAFRAYAAAPGVPLDDAVEASALSQLLDPDEPRDKIDILEVSYELADVERVMECLLSDRRAFNVKFDSRQWNTEAGPPPKASFALLDRVPPTTGVDLKRADVPIVIGQVWVFGKQTDRAARIVLTASRTADYASKLAQFRSIVGDLAAETGTEEVVGQSQESDEALRIKWWFPTDTPREIKEQLFVEQRRHLVLEVWPQLKLSALDGKRPTEAVADPVLRIRVLGAILNQEHGAWAEFELIDFNELRAKLGLPIVEPIDPATVDLSELPLSRIPRLIAAKLSDDDLVANLEIAAAYQLFPAIRRFSAEIVSRESLKKSSHRAVAYALLARTSTTLPETLQNLAQARRAAEEVNMSPAPFLVQEFELLLMSGDGEAAVAILERLRAHHMNEPGIGQRVYSILARLGLVTPDGRVAMPAPRPGPAAPAAAGSRLWTPDNPGPVPPVASPAAPAPAPEQKSKLWIPGMD